jgi:hypothetical protein
MYATEYDLMVAQSLLRDRQNEMRMLSLARTSRENEAVAAPSLIDRLFSLVGRGHSVRATHSKVGAAA